MTLSDLRTQVSVALDDLAAGYFTNTQIDIYLNNAQREVQKLLLNAGQSWYMKCSSSRLIADIGCYFLPSNFLKMHRFDVITANFGLTSETRRTLVHLTPQEITSVPNGPGLPCGYFLKKNTFELKCIPDQAYYIEMLYSYLVSDMTLTTDTPDVPDQYQELLVILACIDGFLRDQRDIAPFMAKKDFYIDMMKKDSQQRLQDQPRSVVMAGGNYDDYSAW